MSYIPEKIAYVCPSDNLTALHRCYKISKLLGNEDKINEKLLKEIDTKDVLHAYPVDADKPQRIEAASKWAMSHYSVKQDKQLTTFVFDNEIPIIRILNLEIRGEGGRAYKCVDQNGFYFDLREDTLLDIFDMVGIEKGGIVRAKFVWAMIGSQTTLLLKDSDRYKELIKLTDNSKLDPIKIFKKGFEYETKKGLKYLYLGEYFAYDFVDPYKYYHNFYYSTNRYRTSNFTKSNTHCKLKIVKIKLFIRICSNEIVYYSTYYVLSKPAVFIKESSTESVHSVDIPTILEKIKSENIQKHTDLRYLHSSIIYSNFVENKKDLVILQEYVDSYNLYL